MTFCLPAAWETLIRIGSPIARRCPRSTPRSSGRRKFRERPAPLRPELGICVAVTAPEVRTQARTVSPDTPKTALPVNQVHPADMQPWYVQY